MERAWEQIRAEFGKAVIVQDELIEQLLISILSAEHSMLVGAPGAAKSLMAMTLARVLGLDFHRLRCTPDLTPDDVTQGVPLPEATPDAGPSEGGPLFANVLLVDGMDRLAPKTQSVLHQAIQDREVIVRGQRRRLPNPFLLLATRYPADEDCLDAPYEPRDDRFMLQIRVGYPTYHQEYGIADAMAAAGRAQPQQILSAAEILLLQQQVRQVDAPPHTLHYATRLVRSTRVHEGENPDFIYEWVSQGAGPRAVHYLTLAGKVRAALRGRHQVANEDIRAVAHSVLRHRVITNRNARSNGITVDRVIDRLLNDVPDRVAGDDTPPGPAHRRGPQDWSSARAGC